MRTCRRIGRGEAGTGGRSRGDLARRGRATQRLCPGSRPSAGVRRRDRRAVRHALASGGAGQRLLPGLCPVPPSHLSGRTAGAFRRGVDGRRRRGVVCCGRSGCAGRRAHAHAGQPGLGGDHRRLWRGSHRRCRDPRRHAFGPEPPLCRHPRHRDEQPPRAHKAAGGRHLHARSRRRRSLSDAGREARAGRRPMQSCLAAARSTVRPACLRATSPPLLPPENLDCRSSSSASA